MTEFSSHLCKKRILFFQILKYIEQVGKMYLETLRKNTCAPLRELSINRAKNIQPQRNQWEEWCCVVSKLMWNPKLLIVWGPWLLELKELRSKDNPSGLQRPTFHSQITSVHLLSPQRYYRYAAGHKGSDEISSVTIPKPSSSLTKSKTDLLNTFKSLSPRKIVWTV